MYIHTHNNHFYGKVSHCEVPFLDLLIYKSEPKLFTRLYVKPTDRHMYLRYVSEHS